MNTRPTIIAFLAAVIAVVAVVMFGELKPLDTAAADGERPFLQNDDVIPVDDVDRIILQRDEDDVEYVWERNGAEWTQVAPFEHPMVPYSMRQYVVRANELVNHGTVKFDDSALSMNDLALETPRATIRYEWGDNGSLELKLGRRGIAGRAYVQHAGENQPVAVVSQGLHERIFDFSPVEAREARLFPDVSIDADRIERRVFDQVMVLERKRSRWQMNEPAATRVDDSMFNQYLETLAKARAVAFIRDQPDQLGSYGLAEPVAELTIVTSETILEDDKPVRVSGSQTLFLGSGCGGGTQDRFAMLEGRPTVFRLSGAAINGLFAEAAFIVDPTGSDARIEDIRSIRIDGPEGAFTLARAASVGTDTWIAPDHDNVQVSASLIAQLVDQLTTLRASGVEFAEYPTNLNVATVTFFGNDRRAFDTVRIARDPATGNWALENGDSVLRILPPSIEFRVTPRAFDLESVINESGE